MAHPTSHDHQEADGLAKKLFVITMVSALIFATSAFVYTKYF